MVDDPGMYFPDLLPGWNWVLGPFSGDGTANDIYYRMKGGTARKDTVDVVVEVTTTADRSDAVGLVDFSAHIAEIWGSEIQREGFLGDRSYELYGPAPGIEESMWQDYWCRDNVVGTVVCPEKGEADAWVEHTDVLFPRLPGPLRRPPLWLLIIGVGAVSIVGLVYLARR